MVVRKPRWTWLDVARLTVYSLVGFAAGWKMARAYEEAIRDESVR
jgi:hypothetical protein